ncbi:MAG: L-aspartate oxidase [Gammaproteobacteria bacterium]|nr:MAG: L-aspartate oxidase [Gammaproteobacteria bacterium]
MSQKSYDVLIIGSGVAGLSLALRLASTHKVAVMSKVSITEGSSRYAQGGVAAVIDKDDSIKLHVSDTFDAGASMCDKDVVKHVAKRSGGCIEWLQDLDVKFTTDFDRHGNERLHLTREGGHSQRRVAHVDDATGKEIIYKLVELSKKHENIDIYEHHIVVDLIKSRSEKQGSCIGAYILDKKSDTIRVFKAANTVLATGGASKVYLYTSNPDCSTGDGIAMAWRAGCRVANMEFNQFHPTCLYHPEAKSFLISEAVRGEGGKLVLPDGKPFLHKYDEREELAPRDIVARAIDNEMKTLGIECVYLDISHKGPEFVKEHFPTIHKKCLKFGYDMSAERIPVVPAAHYTCGGVVTDVNGATDVPGLYAIGEVAYTGMHGANRLASNSLMECLVFAETASKAIKHSKAELFKFEIPEWDESQVTDSDEAVVVSHNWDEIRRSMWDYVGIVRTDKRLARAASRIALLQKEIHEYYWNFKVSSDLVELRNLALVASLIVESAQSRRESRGLHFSLDYPAPMIRPLPTVLDPNK